ncbi:hypothetical protein [Halomonas sp. AOP42-D1-22]|uniref:hypothetical protein n=1 Tax=Halomonas sp. AOP42-D1-22 TaxID=3457667 RepID=UPI0040332CC0
MHGWVKADRQAASVIKELQGEHVKSVRSAGNYEAALKNVAQHLKDEHKAGREAGSLRDLTPQQAQIYLEQRGQEVGQKQLDLERQSIQLMQRHVTGQLPENGRLPVVKSEQQQALNSRSYTPQQISAVIERQGEKNALSSQIAHSAGLRAHELYTLRPASEQPADLRPARDEKFSVRPLGERYTVIGKGGLTREVSIPKELAQRLETTRLSEPRQVTDRGVHYQQRYNINGGQRWSSSWSQASNAALSWSNGAHGLRHSYAQERMGELQRSGLQYRDALETVSQEMGHFRDTITEVYLR